MNNSKDEEREFQIEILLIRLKFSQGIAWATVLLSITFSIWISSNIGYGSNGIWDFRTFLLFNISAIFLLLTIVSFYSWHLRHIKNEIAALKKKFIE